MIRDAPERDGRGDHHVDRSESETAYCPDCGQVVEVENHFSEGRADE